MGRSEVQADVYELISGWTKEDHDYLRAEVPRTALQTPFRGGTLQDLAKQARACAAGGCTPARRRVFGLFRLAAHPRVTAYRVGQQCALSGCACSLQRRPACIRLAQQPLSVVEAWRWWKLGAVCIQASVQRSGDVFLSVLA